MQIHEPQIVTDGGPWAEHDYACPVYADQHAVLVLDDGVFRPSGAAQRDGWRLVQARSKFHHWLLRTFFAA